MTEITFYTNPMSRGRTVRWMLEEMGIEYETIALDFGPMMKTPEYLTINPMGKVPALRHGSRIITECAAICTYLATTFPEAKMMPEDHGAFYRWMFFGAGPLEHAMADKRQGTVMTTDQDKGYASYGCMDDVVRVLSDHLSRTTYLCGETFSAVDVYTGSQIGMGMAMGMLPETPAMAAYSKRIEERPARMRAQQLDNALMPKDQIPDWAKDPKDKE